MPQIPGKYVYASVHVRSTLWGRIKSLLYKPSEMYIWLHPSNAAWVGPYRFLTDNADGLFLSAWANSAQDLDDIFSGQPNRQLMGFQVTSFAPEEYDAQVCAQLATESVPSAPR